MLGIVTGLVFEADILRPYESKALRVRAAGLAPDAAAAAAEALLGQGATALMSFGVAGGLDRALTAGGAIVSATVVGERSIVGDCDWARRLAQKAALHPDGVRTVAHAGIVLTSAEEKAALFAKTGAAVADMESFAVAAVAERHRMPFIALRAVADTAQDRVPSVGIRSMGVDGRVRMSAAIAGALTHPWEIPELMTLGAQTARAKQTLRALARAHAAGGFGLI